ncbi:hypothetical protein [Campylobacter sp. 2014D-0216]|uniref:hypothetical protein n=1 Tax=Campylobacter sp. 2014D-0216 TaxID=1813595 RepID=UPI0018A4BB48|nr:hypothetical protein [Campylobacter sp. 2014D-0216]QOR01581.1 hypothetical protein A0083_02170 [Campylobacter sp. 2014D-0216]
MYEKGLSMFGFNAKGDLVPVIFKDLKQEYINDIFLNLYNALVDNDLKVSYFYAKKASSIRNIFELKIQSMCKSFAIKRTKIKYFCPYSHKIIKAFMEGSLAQLNLDDKSPKYTMAKMIQHVFLSSEFILNPQVGFESFVYEKICRSNVKAKVDIWGKMIVIDNKMAIMPLFYDDNKKYIEMALSFIRENSFERFYIVYPRNKNFTQHKEIRHNLCENNKTLLKLVPYTINNQILRRC